MPPTTTRSRPAALVPALLALVALLLPLAPTPPAGATGAEPERPARFLRSAEVLHTLAGRLVLTQDTATSRRAPLVSHAWRVDTGGTRSYDLVVFLGRKDKRPSLFRTPDFARVPCRAASRERSSGGSGSTITVPGACLRRDGRAPRTVDVQAQTTVMVTRRGGGTVCRTESTRWLGPYARGEGGGFASGGGSSPSPSGRLVPRPPTSRGC